MKETYTNIDELVRDQLRQLPLEAPSAAGWEAMERTLDAPDDAHLRNALTGLAATEAATGWYALESKLGHRSAAETVLAEKLNTLRPAVAAGSWETLAAKMNQENDDAVDAIVTDGLARSAPSGSSGWAALAARLELIGWRRSTVAAWKVTESALLMSLILLLFRFGPEQGNGLGPVAELDNGFPLPMTSVAVGETTEYDVTANQENDNSQTESTGKVTKMATSVIQESKLRASKMPLVLPTEGIIATAQTPATTRGSKATGKNVYLPETIASLEIRPLQKRVVIPSPMLNLAEIDNSAPVYYYANGFVSPMDVNQVITPGHLAGEFDINSERRYTTGFTAGGLLDINKGRNTLQIGVIYSRRAYLPASLEWRYQEYFTPRNPVKGYSEFIYHAIEFPFNYKHTLSENDRWRVAARVGMSLSVIAKPVIKDHDEIVAKFEAFEEEIAADGYSGPSSFFPNGIPSGQRPPQGDHTSERELKELPKGWLEGGSMLVNSSFYLQGGLTVERIMNPRWSLYLSPSIGRVIYFRDGEGVGPYRDRINLGGLRMGSRYRFGGK